ncbi:MAG: glycerophosphodiester phosphodiesterase [Sterolibacterium sp.]
MDWRYPRYIAHRGGGALAPENTLAGIRLAARLGFRAIEFDVMLSADGVPVLFHDETLERTTDGRGKLAEHTLAQLRKLDAGSKHHPAFAGESIPTLDEALVLCRKLNLAANIELKPSPGTEHGTGLAVTRQTQEVSIRWPQLSLLLSSFSKTALAAARKVADELPRALLVKEISDDWQTHQEKLGCQALHCAAEHFHPERAAAIDAAGYALACYTVNREEQANQFFAAGVSAIFTDRLDLFAPHL